MKSHAAPRDRSSSGNNPGRAAAEDAPAQEHAQNPAQNSARAEALRGRAGSGAGSRAGAGGRAALDQGAVRSALGERAADKGGAQRRSADKGRVRLLLPGSGAAVSPPDFPGGLAELHAWLMDNRAGLAGYRGDLLVRISGTVQQRAQVIWSYWQEGQRLVLEGGGDGVVSGLSAANGTDGKPYATPGYFLAYRPIIPQQMTAQNPASANFAMRGLTVRGFVSGGVEISPRSGQPPAADAWRGLDPEAGHGDGGITAFLSGAEITGNTFEQMGTAHMAPGAERYAPARIGPDGRVIDADGYRYAGYGGVIARGLNASRINGNTFRDLTNRRSARGSEVDGSKVEWESLMHGVYLRDHSSANTLRRNRFDTISGAAVKLTNDASRNKIRENRADRTGRDAFALEHYNATANPGGAPEVDSAGYGNARVSVAPDGKRYIFNNRVGTGYQRGYTRRPQKEFHEKRVG